jgi:CubicO group peptidase (beta-lactamase class C family)
MKRRLTMLALLLATTISTTGAAPSCQFDVVAAGSGEIGQWIDRDNWLAVDNQRVSLQAADVFMPARRVRPAAGGEALRAAPRPLDIDRLETTDPFDGRKRDLGFLLDSRLEADGVLVLHNGKILSERYRNGLRAGEPRLLLQTTRPLLALLGAMSIAQGKLTGDKAVTRFVPALNSQSGLRKLSVQRLLQGQERHAWAPQELAQWRQAGGWTSSQRATGIRSWLSQPGRWDKPLVEQEVPPFAGSPDDDLLAWLLAESNAIPLARLFCEQLLIRSRHEHPVFWLTDSQGIELADGLGLSLRDFGRLGQLLLDARVSRSRSRIPAWFVETLTASSGIRSPEVPGLQKGSEQRYGFMHLGGKPNRVAIIGPHGTSLYVDFDRRLVIAVYATYPIMGAPALLATLEQFWKVVDQAASQTRQR